MRNLAIILSCCLIATAARATTYNYTFKAVTPAGGTYAPGGPRDYGYVALPAGAVIGSGTLSVSDTVNHHQSPNPTDCPGVRCDIQSRTITSMTGTFLGEALTFYANPNPPDLFSVGRYIGNDQLVGNQDWLLDAGGLIFSTPTLGTSNLLGFGDPTYPPYGLYDSNQINAPTRTGEATEHFYGDFAITLAEETMVPGGSEDAPTALPFGSVSAINGLIGPGNLQQFYSFDWTGGLFTSTAKITDAQSSDNFRFILNGPGTRQNLKFNADDNFTKTISADLAPGRYSIGLLATLDVDPAFSILFGSAVGSSAPEPASWMTMILGFGAIGAATRRGRRIVCGLTPSAPAP